jgi:hypothetical protein
LDLNTASIAFLAKRQTTQQLAVKDEIADIDTYPILFEVKKVISSKSTILIKIRLHNRVPCNKLFQTRPPHGYISIKNFNKHLSQD